MAELSLATKCLVLKDAEEEKAGGSGGTGGSLGSVGPVEGPEVTENGAEPGTSAAKLVSQVRQVLPSCVRKHCQIEVQKEYFWTSFSNHREIS